MNNPTKIKTISIADVENRLIPLRGQMVLLDRDLAELYGVETKRVNEAVKNNPDKFPAGYVWEMTEEESEVLRSKISTLEPMNGKSHYSKYNYKDFCKGILFYISSNSSFKPSIPWCSFKSMRFFIMFINFASNNIIVVDLKKQYKKKFNPDINW